MHRYHGLSLILICWAAIGTNAILYFTGLFDSLGVVVCGGLGVAAAAVMFGVLKLTYWK